MSKHLHSRAVVEWTPVGVTIVVPESEERQEVRDLAGAAALIGSREAVLSIGRRACFVRTAWVPDAPRKDVLRGLSVSLSQHLPLEASDACLGFRLHQQTGPEGRRATLVAMKAEDLRSILADARAAGLNVSCVVPSVAGGWEIARHQGEGTYAVVSSGVDGIAIDVVSGGELLATRSLPPGMPVRHVEQEVCRTFSTAGVPCSPSIAAGIELDFADMKTEAGSIEAIARGAWLDFGITFELPETVIQRERQEVLKQAWRGALACVVAIAVIGWVAFERLSAAAEVAKARAEAVASSRKLKATRDSAVSQATKLAAADAVLQRAFQPPQKLGDVAVVISNAVPPGAWLNGLSLERGKSVQIRGAAISNDAVSKYLEALTKEPRFRDVRLVFANNAEIESTKVVQFAITAFPVGNLPIEATDKEGRG